MTPTVRDRSLGGDQGGVIAGQHTATGENTGGATDENAKIGAQKEPQISDTGVAKTHRGGTPQVVMTKATRFDKKTGRFTKTGQPTRKREQGFLGGQLPQRARIGRDKPTGPAIFDGNKVGRFGSV